MGVAADYGKEQVLERLHAAGGDINYASDVSVISIDIAAVCRQIVYRGYTVL